jgi:hypothetical protein
VTKKIGPIVLDGETADRITVLNLKEYRSYLKKELTDFKKGSYLHPEDVAGNIKAVEALNLIIKHFGSE